MRARLVHGRWCEALARRWYVRAGARRTLFPVCAGGRHSGGGGAQTRCRGAEKRERRVCQLPCPSRHRKEVATVSCVRCSMFCSQTLRSLSLLCVCVQPPSSLLCVCVQPPSPSLFCASVCSLPLPPPSLFCASACSLSLFCASVRSLSPLCAARFCRTERCSAPSQRAALCLSLFSLRRRAFQKSDVETMAATTDQTWPRQAMQHGRDTQSEHGRDRRRRVCVGAGGAGAPAGHMARGAARAPIGRKPARRRAAQSAGAERTTPP